MKVKQPELPTNFPQRLKQIRLSRGWSQGQLGKKLGVDLQRISKYERGTSSPPIGMVVKIASTLEVSLDYLLRNEADLAVNKIKNPQLLKKIEEIENLPEKDQETLTILLDAFIKKRKFEALATEV